MRGKEKSERDTISFSKSTSIEAEEIIVVVLVVVLLI